MQAVTGVFSFRADAERAVGNLRSTGVPANKITLLIPENVKKELESVPVDAAEQPGMGNAVGAVVGAAAGLSGGSLVMAAVVPGVGPVTAVGLLGAMESETRGSRRVFFALSEPSPVQIRMRSPSRPTQMGTLCGEPSGIRVARWAKLGASSKALISSESGIAMTTVLGGNVEQIYHVN